MRRIFLMSSVLFVAPFVFGEMGEASAQCVATTDCASLGYTEASCPNGGIKCPFGNTWNCKGTGGNGSGDGPIGGDAEHCNDKCCIGWIYYSDGSCSEKRIGSKVPLGVIVYLNSYGGGQVITPRPVMEGINWAVGDKTKYNIKTLPDLDAKGAIKDFESCLNTDKIMAEGDETLYPAAGAARNYVAPGAPETKGKWCLPAAGVFVSLYNNLSRINTGLRNIEGIPFIDLRVGERAPTDYEHLWSSTEGRIDNEVWQSAFFSAYNPPCKINMSTPDCLEGKVKWSGGVSYYGVVRAVYEF